MTASILLPDSEMITIETRAGPRITREATTVRESTTTLQRGEKMRTLALLGRRVVHTARMSEEEMMIGTIREGTRRVTATRLLVMKRTIIDTTTTLEGTTIDPRVAKEAELASDKHLSHLSNLPITVVPGNINAIHLLQLNHKLLSILC